MILSGLTAIVGREAELTMRGRVTVGAVVVNGIDITFSMLRAAAVPAGMGMLADRPCLEAIFTAVGGCQLPETEDVNTSRSH